MPRNFALLLKNAADDFRAIASAIQRHAPTSPVAGLLCVQENGVLARVGQAVIDASQVGALQLDGLPDLVSQYIDRSEGASGGKATEVMCPENLFLALIGGCQVKFVNANPRVVSPLTAGGLLPRLGLLPESTPTGLERYARACDALAELIEAAPTLPVDGGAVRLGEPGVCQSANWLASNHGIRGPRLSEASKIGSVRTVKAPANYRDNEGKWATLLYHVGDALKHCSPKRRIAKRVCK